MEDIEKGFLKSTLLIRVRTLLPYLQSILTVCKMDFSMIFTLPLSAQGNLNGEVIPACGGRQKSVISGRPPVSTELKMDGQVMARAIAYTAVQVWVLSVDFPDLHHYSSFTLP